jgi:hypothetical protein
VVIADCTQQRQQQEQGRLDRLKQQMTARQHVNRAVQLDQRGVQRLADRRQQLAGGHLLLQPVE